MRRHALVAFGLALCTALPFDLVQREQAPLLQEAHSAESQGAARDPTRFILFFVPMPNHGRSHHNMSKYVAGLRASCSRLLVDGKMAFFAGDHSFIYAQKIFTCYPFVLASPPALNFTYDDLPFKRLTEDMPTNCSYKFANLSRSDPPTPLGLYKQVARIYLSKIDILCNAVSGLRGTPGQRFALLDAMIGSNENLLPEADSYFDATVRFESETLAPGVLRTQLYSGITSLLQASIGNTVDFFRTLQRGVGALRLYGQPQCTLPRVLLSC